MKILLVDKFHYRFGGAERAYFDTADVLKKNGHKIAFFSMHHPKNEKTYWSKFFVSQVSYNQGGQNYFEKAKAAINIIWNREAQRKIEALIEEFQPDVAHLHLIYHQISPSIIWTLKKHGIPIVMTLHDYKHICPNYDMFVRGKIWERSPWHCIGDRCIRDGIIESVICTFEYYFHTLIGTFGKVDKYIAPSKFLIEKSRSHNWKYEIEHIPQPLAPEDFDTGDDNNKNNTDIVYVGRLSVEKGVKLLIDAFLASKKQTLSIVGTGPEEKFIQEYVKKNDKDGRVTLHGFLSGQSLRNITHNAQAIVIPSVWYENMPYALLEALASGAVVIAAARGGMTEKINHGENGFLFNTDNPEELTDILNNLDKVDILSISKKAQKSVSNLTHGHYYKDLIRIYTEISYKNCQKEGLVIK